MSNNPEPKPRAVLSKTKSDSDLTSNPPQTPRRSERIASKLNFKDKTEKSPKPEQFSPEIKTEEIFSSPLKSPLKSPVFSRITHNMTNKLSLSDALRLVSDFNGEKPDELSQFITSCEFVIDNINDDCKNLIIKGLMTKLKSKAHNIVKYKDIKTWNDLKQTLNDGISNYRSTADSTNCIKTITKQ